MARRRRKKRKAVTHRQREKIRDAIAGARVRTPARNLYLLRLRYGVEQPTAGMKPHDAAMANPAPINEAAVLAELLG